MLGNTRSTLWVGKEKTPQGIVGMTDPQTVVKATVVIEAQENLRVRVHGSSEVTGTEMLPTTLHVITGHLLLLLQSGDPLGDA
jgi:uncharacterized protein YjiK